MKTLYIDCGMGAAGDMLTAALLELVPEPEEFLSRFRQMGIPGVDIIWEKVSKCGILGNHISVLVHGEEEHSENTGQERCYHGQGQMHSQNHVNEQTHDHACGQAFQHQCDHEHQHHHMHTNMQYIQKIMNMLDLPEEVRADVEAVYGLIAAAESSVHGVPVEEIHFHEVANCVRILLGESVG